MPESIPASLIVDALKDTFREARAALAAEAPGASRPGEPLGWVLSVPDTHQRTVLTALTTFLSAAILLAFGGKVLEDFAFVLVIGVVTGTYSTIYIAGAIIVDWTRAAESRVGRRKKAVAKA
jgi:hypothetical protein